MKKNYMIHAMLFINSSADIFTQESLHSIENIIQKNSHINYQKCTDSHVLNFKPFPIDYKPTCHPHNPEVAETFILKIPRGSVYSPDGIIIIDDHILTKLIWQNDVSKKRLSPSERAKFTPSNTNQR